MSHPATIDPRGMLRGAATGAELDAHAANAVAHGAVVIPTGGVLVTGVAHNAPTNPYTLPWAAATFDPDGYWNAGAPTRLTVPVGKGGRLFLAQCAVEINNASAEIAFWVNGALAGTGPICTPYLVAHSTVLYLADGAYLTAVLMGTTANIIVNDQVPTLALVPL